MKRRPGRMLMAVGAFVVVLLALQIFLLSLSLEALLDNDAGLAWVAAATSILLSGAAVLLYRAAGRS